MEVRKSAIHGSGVFAASRLSGRRKLGEIAGILRRLPEARRSVENDPQIYLIEISRWLALDCTDSNIFKYLNHSCRANCYLRVWRRRVEVYTLRTIEAGSELTVDYGTTPHRQGMRCQCGSPVCRGLL